MALCRAATEPTKEQCMDASPCFWDGCDSFNYLAKPHFAASIQKKELPRLVRCEASITKNRAMKYMRNSCKGYLMMLLAANRSPIHATTGCRPLSNTCYWMIYLLNTSSNNIIVQPIHTQMENSSGRRHAPGVQRFVQQGLPQLL